MLHLWSLSVEEQFYILWPACLIVIYKIRLAHNLKLVVLSVIAVLSFIGASLMANTGRFEDEAFFYLPPRAGELLIGCILALYEAGSARVRQSFWITGIGVIALAISIIFYNHQILFPGVSALLPCFGVACLISQYDNPRSLVNKLLSSGIAVYIGKISYSLYLWHWPILAIPRYLYGELSTSNLFLLAAISIILAHLSWAYLETPIRQRKMSLSRAALLIYFVPALVVIAALGIRPVIPNTGLELSKTSYSSRYQAFCYRFGVSHNCKFGDQKTTSKTILFGDSHAAHFTPYWDKLGEKNRFALDAFSAQTCYPLLSTSSNVPGADPSILDKVHCPKHLSLVDSVIDNYDVVILAAAWTMYLEGTRSPKSFDFTQHLSNQLERFGRQGKKVIIMAQVPFFNASAIKRIQHQAGIPYQPIRELVTSNSLNKSNPMVFETISNVDMANKKIQQIARQFSHVLFWQATANDLRTPFQDGKLIYANAGHLSPEGSVTLAEKIDNNKNSKLRKWLQP